VLINFLLAVLTGLLLVFIHPRFSQAWLAPFALTPLIVALAREYRPKYRFLLGYVAGMVFWGGMCYWIHFVMSFHGGLGDVLGAGVFILFFLIPSLNMGVFGLFGGVLVHRRYAVPALAALWVALERIPSPFGFMWLKLGDGGIDMSVPLRLAPITGVYGLSFVFALMAGAVALVVLRRPRRELLPLIVLPGLYALPEVPAAAPPTESAAVVQPNFDEEKQWTEADTQDMHQRLEYLSLSSALAAREPAARLVLWPEVPAPIYFYEDMKFRDRAQNLARLTKTYFLFGTVARTPTGDPLNSAVMLTPGGDVQGRYDKMLLVPFGEYVPSPFSFANKISKEIGNFYPGEKITIFNVGDRKVGAFICYESAFPHFVRKFDSDVFVNLSNDGYFGRSAAREQHVNLVRMRATENRRWVVRSTNNGISTSIDPAGRVLGTFPEFREHVGRLGYGFAAGRTFYSQYGDWFAWTCALGAAIALVVSQLPNRD
jgi:apolipoprotein N-acyltransferase